MRRYDADADEGLYSERLARHEFEADLDRSLDIADEERAKRSTRQQYMDAIREAVAEMLTVRPTDYRDEYGDSAYAHAFGQMEARASRIAMYVRLLDKLDATGSGGR